MKNRPYIGRRTKRNFPFLYLLFKTRSAKRRFQIVESATPSQLQAIIDVCSNIARKNFPVSKRYARVVRRYEDFLKKAARAKDAPSFLKVVQNGEGLIINPSASRKRDQFKIARRQYGYGFLPAVLVPVLFEIAHQLGPKAYDLIKNYAPKVYDSLTK